MSFFLINNAPNLIDLSQFFNFVALPTYIPMAQAFTGCTPVLEAVKANYQYWSEAEAAAAAAAAASASL